jgi:hypothetical protein
LSDERNPLKDRKEMYGDFLREVAALIVIFIPLEVAIRQGATWQLFLAFTSGSFVISGAALLYGIRLERRRFVNDRGRFRNAVRVYFGRVRDWFAQFK